MHSIKILKEKRFLFNFQEAVALSRFRLQAQSLLRDVAV